MSPLLHSRGFVVQGFFARPPVPSQAIQRQLGGCWNAAISARPGVEAFRVNLQPRVGGLPLPPAVQAKMETALGASFSDVRIHINPEASAIGALAFTWGPQIHFAPGQYNPHIPHGQELLAHELVHVMQQRAGRVANPFGSGVAVVRSQALEAEAERLGRQAAMSHPKTSAVTHAPSPHNTHQVVNRKINPAAHGPALTASQNEQRGAHPSHTRVDTQATMAFPGVLQRAVRIGDGPKSLFVKKRAILQKLMGLLPGTTHASIMAVLGAQGTSKLEAQQIATMLTNPGNFDSLMETIADLFSQKNTEFRFDSWSEAVREVMPFVLPISVAKAGLNHTIGLYEASRIRNGAKTSTARDYASNRFLAARKHAQSSAGCLDFSAWTEAVSWAQVLHKEEEQLNREEEKATEPPDSWQTSKGKGTKRREAHENFSIAALAHMIEAHVGRPEDISIRFNQFINAVEAQNVLSTHNIVSSYQTHGDRSKKQFSIEVRLPLLNKWVLHVHCNETNGATASGLNAMHYKRLSDRFSLGQSIALTGRQEGLLLPPLKERLDSYT